MKLVKIMQVVFLGAAMFLLTACGETGTSVQSTSENTASAPASYEVGDKVRHIKFGNGEVIDVIPSGGDQEIVVNFDRVGEKHLFASLVKMKKL